MRLTRLIVTAFFSPKLQVMTKDKQVAMRASERLRAAGVTLGGKPPKQTFPITLGSDKDSGSQRDQMSTVDSIVKEVADVTIGVTRERDNGGSGKKQSSTKKPRVKDRKKKPADDKLETSEVVKDKAGTTSTKKRVDQTKHKIQP